MNIPVQPTMTYAAIMNIRVAFSENNEKKGDKKIEALSRVLALSAPAISERNGVVTRVSEEGIGAVFERDAENVILASFDVFSNASQVFDDEELSKISIGIHWGPVYLARLSYGTFTTPIAISSEVLSARKLSESARRYDSRILVTDAAVCRIRSFENRFNSRRLGMIRNSLTGKDEIVYDVFDSDNTELKYSKRRSKLVFETGVRLYLQGEYLQSRAYFIEILKYDRNDKTAKKYVFMCDKALSEEAPDPMQKYLEIW